MSAPPWNERALALLEEMDSYWRWEPCEHVVVPLGRPATVEDLRRTKMKAEIVDGEMVVIGPSGGFHARAVGSILYSLHLYMLEFGGGCPVISRVAFVVDLPHRLAISPDVSWFTGSWGSADFPRGAPVFAVEVREGIEYTGDAERRMAAKRADYFAAGTQVVWDVDVLREGLIRVYRADDPEHAMVYRQGEVSEAEPAVPGWRFPVDEMFD